MENPKPEKKMHPALKVVLWVVGIFIVTGIIAVATDSGDDKKNENPVTSIPESKPAAVPQNNNDESICEEWISDVVRSFCIKNKVIENYINKIKNNLYDLLLTIKTQQLNFYLYINIYLKLNLRLQ